MSKQYDSVNLKNLSDNLYSIYEYSNSGSFKALDYSGDELGLEKKYNEDYWSLMRQASSFTSEELSFYNFKNALIYPLHGLVLWQNGTFLKESQKYGGSKPFFGINRQRSQDYLKVPNDYLDDIEVLDESKQYFLLSNSPCMNYCHFHVDIMSSLIPLREQINSGEITLIWGRGFKGFHMQILTELKIDYKKIFKAKNKLYSVPNVIKPSSNFQVHKKTLCSSVPVYFDLNWKGSTNFKLEKIYLKRTLETAKRQNDWENLNELEELLLSMNFEFIDPGKLCFKDQVSLFSNAKIIVALHGAALTNVGFCKRKSSTTIEILPELRPNRVFYNISKFRQNRHIVLMAKALLEGKDFNNNRYSIPIEDIRKLLNSSDLLP